MPVALIQAIQADEWSEQRAFEQRVVKYRHETNLFKMSSTPSMPHIVDIIDNTVI